MTLALTDEHRRLADVVRSFLSDRGALAAAREQLEAQDDKLPPFWDELCTLGWPALHVPEQLGGQGYGLPELAIVVEELGRTVAPGPFVPTVWASAVLLASATSALQADVVPDLAAGRRIGAVGLGGSLVADADGTVTGDGGLVLSGGQADVMLLRVGDDMALVERNADGLTATTRDGLDPTRRLAAVECSKVRPVAIVAGAAVVATRVGATLAAAEAAGGARACTEMAVAYAKQREQFGRVIGSFQAVKHHCANMLVDTELAAAVAWDAARATSHDASAQLAAVIAATQALPGYRRCAETNIQVHGGIGYTWEHDAHLHLRRAASLAALFGADGEAPREVARRTGEGQRPRVAVDLPLEADRYRDEARAFRMRYDALPRGARRESLIESGYLMPHWPPPWGRGADVAEQLVIEEELAGVETANLGIGTWVVLTLIQHGTPDQLERWVRPSLEGTLRWCQLFSEPNAGSDAAAIRTRAVCVDGGWLVNGQKVWTSGARESNWGLATVRTDPDARKHAGVTTLAIDMRARGVDVRPLRELTGETLFNEVFFDDVFVPDDDVVGTVNQGWTVARATLGNERVSIGGSKGGLNVIDATDLAAMAERWAPGDAAVLVDVGAAIAEGHAMAALNLRHISRALAGAGPGAEGNVSKLLSAEHAQRVAGLGLRLLGRAGVAGVEPSVARYYLFTRCLTIAGGTSEIVRSLIAERLLGLPRDPLQS
jgi:alkylation response protein AidB-like acyl-CoA dehydrogenase